MSLLPARGDRGALIALLRRLDGQPWGGWRELVGVWDVDGVGLEVLRAQPDPFAPPSPVRLRVGSPARPADGPARTAAEDWLLRQLTPALEHPSVDLLRPGPSVERRTAVCVHADGQIELRLRLALPGAGRRVDGRAAAPLLTERLPGALRAAVATLDGPGHRAHEAALRLQRALRAALRDAGLIGFIADGAVLPRAAGDSERPLPGAVAWRTPPGLAVELPSPVGPLRGMGIPRGVTLIVGGAFHGKSTLLRALQTGHRDHPPGDGRERVVADPDTLALRAEDGRQITAVDLRWFLGPHPGNPDARPLTTPSASGATSQAAALIEGLEGGARALLLDEDSSATNLLIRDARMRALVPDEPITPLVARLPELSRGRGVSVVLVAGALGDLLPAADTVIGMSGWAPVDLRAQARAIAGPPGPPPPPAPPPWGRELELRSLAPPGDPGAPSGEGRGPRVRARDARAVEIGARTLDLSGVAQVDDAARARSLGAALARLSGEGGRLPLPVALDRAMGWQAAEGPDAWAPRGEGDRVEFRRHELAAAISRLRGAQLHPVDPSSVIPRPGDSA